MTKENQEHTSRIDEVMLKLNRRLRIDPDKAESGLRTLGVVFFGGALLGVIVFDIAMTEALAMGGVGLLMALMSSAR